MTMKLILSGHDPTDTTAELPIAISDEAIDRAAKKLNYPEVIADPNAESRVRQKQIAFLQAQESDPNSAETNQLGVELQQLQQSGSQPIANTLPKSMFVVEHFRDYILSLFIDEAGVQAAGEAAAKAKKDEEMEAAVASLGLTPTS